MSQLHPLQIAVEPLGFTAALEPISGADLYYSDGLVQGCSCKVVFTSKANPLIQYVFFIPYFCFHSAPPADLKAAFDMWLPSLNISRLLEEEK
jgi:hypothetical protein